MGGLGSPRMQHFFDDLRTFLDYLGWQVRLSLVMVEVLQFICLLPRKLCALVSSRINYR